MQGTGGRLRRLGLDGEAWVRVEAAAPPASHAQPQEQPQEGSVQQPQEGGVQQGASEPGSEAAARPCVVARVRSLLRGCIDVGGASPRRYFFQVLRHFASSEHERERLSYFATAEGRDDLYRYGRRARQGWGGDEDVAERIAREAALRLFSPVRVQAMDSYDVRGLPSEGLLVCVAATAGQGDPPDNMRRFWRFLLRRSLPPDSLAATAFAVFGLGDSSYPNYNVAAKKLDRRLAGLGATPLLERGLGDDQ
ncbi:NADPH-dependent diflavin oxidoreductase 1, partial [Tetrabaena socialis]